MENIKSTIAKNIVFLRNENGITQIELAEKLNYSDKAVSKWERGESIPDVTVLAQIAEIFNVSLDFLVLGKVSENKSPLENKTAKVKKNNRFVTTALSILLVWLIATLVFVIVRSAIGNNNYDWLAFICAVPITAIVALVFNSIWFNQRRNFIIISLLMWSVLLTLFLSLLSFGINVWLVFLLGIPGQLIIFLWSKFKK